MVALLPARDVKTFYLKGQSASVYNIRDILAFLPVYLT